MRLRPLALSASLVLTAVVSAQAQTSTTVKITAGSVGTPVTSGGGPADGGAYPAGTPNFYVSPYAGLINYNTVTNKGEKVWLNCVDYFHHVGIGDVWTANVTNLGSASSNLSLLANTRYGHAGGVGNYGNVLELYRQAAWLTLQYDPNPGLDANARNKTRAIQSAIWTLFNGYDQTASLPPSYNGPGTTMYDSQWWVNRTADANYNKLTTADLKYFSVLTDDTYPWASDSKQEFLIHVTPEPSTIILMLTGIIAVLVVVRRRRTGASGLEAA